MAYRIEFLPRVERQVVSLPQSVKARISDRIARLRLDPRGSETKAIKARVRGLYRVRIGDYRVVYQIKDEEQVVQIVSVGHRSRVYADIERLEL